jgi:hypothetical protein
MIHFRLGDVRIKAIAGSESTNRLPELGFAEFRCCHSWAGYSQPPHGLSKRLRNMRTLRSPQNGKVHDSIPVVRWPSNLYVT